MTLTFVLAIIFTHFLADWILQPRWMANQKSEKFLTCIEHGFIVWTILFLTLILLKHSWTILPSVISSWNILIFSMLYGVTHILQDWFIWRFYKKFLYRRFNKTVEFYNDYWFYTTISIDQFIHLTLLFFILQFTI